ncbi:sigma 54-interacting transcriptional regulator [Clostridium saudiense]|nr:sigma 54-interacting transcriptional regulator [Clostridium saudiense]
MNKENLIEKSHERSKEFGVPIKTNNSKKKLKENEVYDLLEKNKELISISMPYINMVCEIIEDDDFILILTDKDGCILDIKGDEGIVHEFAKLNLDIGVFVDEKNIGTNAMGVALAEDRPVQVTADEHYVDMFKGLTCSAAPIHNIKGDIIGTLNLTGRWDKRHPHTLGLVIFGVKAIENEIHNVKSQEILQETYNYMDSIIKNLDKGVVIVDSRGRIKNINEQGATILEVNKINIINRKIDFILPDWNKIFDILEADNISITREIKTSEKSNFNTKLNIKGVRDGDKLIGLVITLRDEKKSNAKGIARYNFEDIIGSSYIMKNVISNCKIVANSPSTILIQGESGTGKEVLAQSIHNYSFRKNNRFIAINCGAIPSNLIESELFGYEDGTFTGGKKGGKIGKIEMANGGTLFLDEIGEMPLEHQVNLLRVIQEGKITRLGGTEEISVDVRIIAATNKNLKKEIEMGRFREDLYYRLCVIPINLPPLRERSGDIRELINHFLRMKSFKLNKAVPEINEDLYNKLINYSWPGNIRELENVIENIVNLDGYMSFSLELECEIKNKEVIVEDEDIKNEVVTLEFIEKKHIIKVLRKYKNNIYKSSNALGISRNTLYSKIKKYQIEVY